MPLRFSAGSVRGAFTLLAFLSLSFLGSAAAQTAVNELQIENAPLPKALLRQPYHWGFTARGGVPPLRWELSGGTHPDGLVLNDDGTLSGKPLQTGEFHMDVKVSDSAHPAQERTLEFVLHVVAPLRVEWSRPAEVVGQRIEGAVKVSNGTDQDFDLTVIIVAVNESGRATALGYQRLVQQEAADVEIPFGETLPAGAYEVNVDAVGEVTASNSIYRQRLVSSRLAVSPPP